MAKLHELETIRYGLTRLAVPGGWMYERIEARLAQPHQHNKSDAISMALCFVPDPDAAHVCNTPEARRRAELGE